MARFVFFILLLAALALGGHLYLSEQARRPDVSARERNPDEVRILAATPPNLAAQRNEESRKTVQSLIGSTCVEFGGIPPAEAPRARAGFAALQLGERLTERPVEEATRFWVFMPPARDRRAAEATVAQLRRQGIADVSLRPDNAVSLGVFSSEEAARRYLASLEAKGVAGAQTGAFVRELRELVMVVRDPDSEILSRLALLQREYPGSRLRAVACPAAEPAKG